MKSTESSVWSEEIDKILRVGIPLEGLGIRNFALSRPMALNALVALGDLGIAILGGDVYLEDREQIQATYDNWYCQKGEIESENDFKERSIVEAQKYIAGYAVDDALFAIVPQLHQK